VAPTVGTFTTVEQIDALAPADIEAIDPTSLVPYRILHDVLHQSWHNAKEQLLSPGRTTPKRKAMMQVLVDYREWHHKQILEEVRGELATRTADAEALKASGGAGSVTLSSDIDVNLKGNHTELAVPLFNERFRASSRLPAHVWDLEPGVVYDVNVYAVDFMHSIRPVVGPGDHQVTVKEGARKDHMAGGISDPAMIDADRHNQLVTALFKTRLFMDAAQWAQYRRLVCRGIPAAALALQNEAFEVAEIRYAGYLDEMFGRIGTRLGGLVDQRKSGVDQLKDAAALKLPGADGVDHHAVEAARENVLMEAANRIYEQKLATIHAERQVLKETLAEYAKYDYRDMLGADPQLAVTAATEVPRLGARIDRALLRLRALIAEAAMYANEASMTDATVSHVVLGLQMGREIDQQKVEGINAVHENLGDVMKEAGRYPTFGQAAFKSGKYMMRMADAGKNLGFGYIWGVQVLYDLGRKISVDIKQRADAGTADADAESEAAARAVPGVTTLRHLLDLAMETAAEISREYWQEDSAHARTGGTRGAYGHRTAATGVANTNVLNQDMLHPYDRDERGMTASSMNADTKGDFAFILTEAELTALKAKWAARAP
jgi:hypothetical protein